MRQIFYLSITQVLAIHYQMIQRFGGSAGIRDMSLIDSALARPRATFDGKDLYPNVYDKASTLLQSLLKNHPFVDGNKRTALTSAGLFLELNGYTLINFHEEEVQFAVKIDHERLPLKEISKWLNDHSKAKN